jgi:hypothetical protein
MSITINDYRCKLVNKILFSTSQEDVKRYIDAAMKGLLQHNVNGHLVTRFVERTAKDLEEFNPMDHGAQQWANIKMARIQFNQLKRSIQTSEQQ